MKTQNKRLHLQKCQDGNWLGCHGNFSHLKKAGLNRLDKIGFFQTIFEKTHRKSKISQQPKFSSMFSFFFFCKTPEQQYCHLFSSQKHTQRALIPSFFSLYLCELPVANENTKFFTKKFFFKNAPYRYIVKFIIIFYYFNYELNH